MTIANGTAMPNTGWRTAFKRQACPRQAQRRFWMDVPDEGVKMRMAVRFLQAHLTMGRQPLAKGSAGVRSARLRFSALLLSSGVMLAASTNASAAIYTYFDLGEGGAYGINDAGQVVGFSGRYSEFRATLWNGVTPTYLDAPTGGGRESVAYGISRSGQAVGRIYEYEYGNGDATVWNGTIPTSLGTLDGQPSYAYGINSAGQVVGSIVTQRHNSGYQQATLWNGRTPTLLDALGSPHTRATGINRVGQAVGWSAGVNGQGSHAVLWNGTAPTVLGTLGGIVNQATGINDAGQVVGFCSNAGDGPGWHAVVWNGTSPTDLGTLGTGMYSKALGINNAGQVVGYSDTVDYDAGARHAVLWNGTVATDLNEFVDATTAGAGWVLQEANGINDSGWIVGTAYNRLTGGTHAYYLMAVVPEPETYALMLAGLGLLGFAARRRRASRIAPLCVRARNSRSGDARLRRHRSRFHYCGTALGQRRAPALALRRVAAIGFRATPSS